MIVYVHFHIVHPSEMLEKFSVKSQVSCGKAQVWYLKFVVAVPK